VWKNRDLAGVLLYGRCRDCGRQYKNLVHSQFIFSVFVTPLPRLPQHPYINPCSLGCNHVNANMDVYPLLPSFQQGTFTTAVGLLFYALACVIYNVFLHPVSRSYYLPGPRGAGITADGPRMCSSVKGSVYLPCGRSFIRNKVTSPWALF
jgi:hypothetical protein